MDHYSDAYSYNCYLYILGFIYKLKDYFKYAVLYLPNRLINCNTCMFFDEMLGFLV